MEAKAKAAVLPWNFFQTQHFSYSGQCSCNGTKNNPLTFMTDETTAQQPSMQVHKSWITNARFLLVKDSY
jgi:hypothetical protein